MPTINPTQIPNFYEMFNPVLCALVKLGGSANIAEIYSEVINEIGFTDDVLSVMHNGGNQSEVAYRLAWSRTYLRMAGYIENSARGVWSLTEKGRSTQEIDERSVVDHVRALNAERQNQTNDDSSTEQITEENLPEEVQEWRTQLHEVLTTQLSPSAFERLTQRLLRESGFIQVEVTGRTGDGGIDGRGVARINGLMSFHVAFQCKKYAGSVGSPEIRNFRGAIQGVADRGLFITTGYFTEAAIKEANRAGASPIDLIDGEQLADKLKELKLGIKTEIVEKVSVDTEWLLSI